MVRAPGQAAASRFSFLVGIVTVTRTSQPLVRVASRGQLGQQRVAALIIPQFHYFSMIAPVTAPCGPLPGRTSDERAATSFATQRLKTGKVASTATSGSKPAGISRQRITDRLASTFVRSRLIAEGFFPFASKPVVLVAIAGREVEGDKSGNARSLCDIAGLTRRKVPPLRRNLRIRVEKGRPAPGRRSCRCSGREPRDARRGPAVPAFSP
jgi:hypothetical protein